MNVSSPSCTRFGVSHTCPECKSEHLVKNGKTETGKQRYSCKKCNKRFIVNYTYNACASNTNQQIIPLSSRIFLIQKQNKGDASGRFCCLP